MKKANETRQALLASNRELRARLAKAERALARLTVKDQGKTGGAAEKRAPIVGAGEVAFDVTPRTEAERKLARASG